MTEDGITDEFVDAIHTQTIEEDPALGLPFRAKMEILVAVMLGLFLGAGRVSFHTSQRSPGSGPSSTATTSTSGSLPSTCSRARSACPSGASYRTSTDASRSS